MMEASNKIRLCVVVTTLPRIYGLVNSLALRHETHVIYVAYPFNGKYIGNISNLYNSYPVAYPYKSGSLAEAGNFKSISFVPMLADMFMKIRRVTHENNIDLIHAHWAIPSGFLASLADGKIPLITTIRGSDIKTLGKRRMIRPFVKYALEKSTRVIAVSNDLKQEAIDLGISADKIFVSPGEVDVHKFKPLNKSAARASLGLPEGFIITYAGNLIKLKRVDRLVRVSARLSRDYDFHLIIVGDGPERANLENLAKDLEFENILFIGTTSHDNMPSYMAASDIFVLPSESEGLPICVQEAMACGIPVIASNVGGLPDIISDGVNGYLVNSDAEMETHLESLISSPSLAAMMGRNAMEFALRHLSLDAAVKQNEDLYASVLAER